MQNSWAAKNLKYTASLLDEGRMGRRWGKMEKKPSNEILVTERPGMIYPSFLLSYLL